MRPLLGQGAIILIFTEMRRLRKWKKMIGVIAHQFRAKRKELSYFFYLHRYRWSFRSLQRKGLRDPKMKWRADSKDLSDLHTLLSTDLFILYFLAPYPVRDGL